MVKIQSLGIVSFIISLSGGKDSTAMTLKLFELGYRVDEIIFFDTGWEFPQIIENIDKLEKYLEKTYNWTKGITRLRPKESFDFLLEEKEIQKGKRQGEKGYGWCQPSRYRSARWCTGQKEKTITKYLNQTYGGSKNYVQYIGFAYDEKRRMKENVNQLYPLNDFKFSEKRALRYCYEKGFDFGGLYRYFRRVSCWCCPLQGDKELKNLFLNFPALWEKLKEMDSKTYNQFRAKYTLEEFESKWKTQKLIEYCNCGIEV
ncbi:phosphoadenosine phosphosulfate reductase domain-containing protein [Methanococcus maripaludis]|uniref:phosphoadenosine phosphosulfate reductase domain-containing protein n=1 Tax=Methanococcus maripaludis TaxID=39152 RepID=UPI002867C5EC|nr:phosphoadenosine phosphosulfate reductase family protein [Methanococcus maripaludis]